MTWVLLVIFYSGNGVTTTNISFDTYELCERARQKINYYEYRSTGYCLRVRDDH